MQCSQKSKLQDIAGDEVGFKQYWKYLTWKNARTVFEVRTNMLRSNANYGQNDEICYKCVKQKETTKHIFECEDSTDDKISRESYRDMIRKAGPRQDSARQSAEAIRNYMDERTKMKQIINRFG